ncbi:MAG: His-Xaa-Ser system protein HxsD [Candidatus Peribacteria bacterium]|jgi:His-Xaa-Ser system protein HxsD|nr:His-Xaa-Ser system protein HxsD [Candidatus Peribacteria bacterium]
METFLKKLMNENKLELVIDTKLFPKDIILKASYNFLDRAYFFFKYDEDKNIILQLSRKDETEDLEKIALDFSDELLSVYLRDKLEKDNKNIREKII